MSEFYQMRGGGNTQGLLDMINHLGDTQNMNMIEIGSYIGESTTIFAKHFKSVICIDPFLNDYDPNDGACHFADFNLVYNKFLENISSFDNIVHIKKTSDDAVSDIVEKVDFIYIDGLHTYEQVKKDILNYKGLLNENCFIGGHDYSDGWHGVVSAIDETIDKPHAIFIDSSWIKRL